MIPNQIIDLYFPGQKMSSWYPISHGLINDSFKIELDSGPSYFVQKVNKEVFPDPQALDGNLNLFFAHMDKGKWEKAGLEGLDLIKGTNGKTLQEFNEEYWRVMNFIQDGVTVHKAPNSNILFDLGASYARLHNQIQDLDPDEFYTVIPGFMDTEQRKFQLMGAIETSDLAEHGSLKILIDELLMFESELQWEILKDTISVLGIHDCKLSNVLFDKGIKRVKAIVDYDTLMKGSYYLDFGDMVRSSCNRFSENQKGEIESPFSLGNFNQLASGFWRNLKIKGFNFSPDLVFLGIINVVWQQAARFLTDHLNHNVYFKIEHPEQNLERAQNQLKLLIDIMDHKPRLFLDLEPLL